MFRPRYTDEELKQLSNLLPQCRAEVEAMDRLTENFPIVTHLEATKMIDSFMEKLKSVDGTTPMIILDSYPCI